MSAVDQCCQILSAVRAGKATAQSLDELRAFRLNAVFRSELGTSAEVWRAIVRALETVTHRAEEKVAIELLLLSRNLLACGAAAQLLASTEQLQKAVYDLLFDLEYYKSTPRDTVSTPCLQVLVNLCARSEVQKSFVWTSLMRIDLTDDHFGQCLRYMSPDSYVPLLVLIGGCVNVYAQLAAEMFTYKKGRVVFRFIMLLSDDWYEHEDSEVFGLICSLGTGVLGHGLLQQAYDIEPEQDDDIARYHLVLVKFVDVYVFRSDDAIEPEVLRSYAEFLVERFLLRVCFPQSSRIMQERLADERVERISTCNLLVMELLANLAGSDEATLGYLQESALVEELIRLLAEADRLVPKHTLKNAASHSEAKPYEFPLLKQHIVRLLSLVTEGSRALQDRVRACGGLAVVLSQCNIDDNNPYIREFAILCVRNLLAGNAANQDFVARLEAKQAVQSSVLEEAGYETEIVDGRVAVKRIAPSSPLEEL
ncbi:spinocerebellar ataxia type 10 protein domain-containing protein [Dipodascopsis tothii]|uniref:spinocerebellar ataxia type 10 protein domain-containing protein n=1 Tax=Dipodascopsis tothii TaxID=44089 RepID=UPI0034CE7A06